MQSIYKYKKILISIPSVVLVWVVQAQTAHAIVAEAAGYLLKDFAFAGILKLLAYITYAIMSIAGFFLALCGTLLNVSMQITTRLDIFIQATPYIYDIWATIRDLASMILIFFILYAAILMIFNGKPANYGNLIKNILVAGILINFSFFFTRIAIDASNIISLQFYNALAPNQTQEYKSTDTLGTVISNAVKDYSGGISGVFMSAMKVNQFWQDNGTTGKSAESETDSKKLMAMILVNMGSALVQFLAALSFLAAAIAALWRTVVLVFLLGFSAVWIAAYAIPQLGPFKEKWMGLFQSNLLFLPVYLGFMYVSVQLISRSNLSSLVTNISTTSSTVSAFVPLFIALAIILFFINLPLFVAISFAGDTTGYSKKISDWSHGFTKKMTYGMAKGAVVGTAGYAARQTIGQGAAALDKAIGNTKLGNSLMARDFRSATIGAVAKNKFGTSRSYGDYLEEQKKVARKGKEIDRANMLQATLKDIKAGNPPKLGFAPNEIIGKMSENEKLALDPVYLKDPNIIKYFRKSDFEAIKKSEDIEDDDKQAIKDARKVALRNAISGNESDNVEHMLKNYDTDDIVSFLNKDYASATDVPDVIVENLTKGQLDAIGKEKIDTRIKKLIGVKVRDWNALKGKFHPGWGLINKNLAEWT